VAAMTEPVFDPTTGEVFPVEDDGESCGRCKAERRRADAIEQDLATETREKRALGRKVKALEQELAKDYKEAPERAEMTTCYRTWLEETGRNPKRTTFGPKREPAVLAAIRMKDARYVERAIVGGAHFANVNNRDTEREALIAALHQAMDLLSETEQRDIRAFYREQMKDVVKYDDLELICRNEVNLERFWRAAGRLPRYQDV
jgi:hypothetical protein